MKHLDQYLLPYLITQGVAAIFLVVAWKNTRLARLLFFLLFTLASITNFSFSFSNPNLYLAYADTALPFYRDFINGWFSRHIHMMVPMIATGQFMIAIGIILKGWWVKWACIGAIIFLMAIAPLMVGSGFPFSFIVSWAAWIVLKKDKKDFLWRKPGYLFLSKRLTKQKLKI